MKTPAQPETVPVGAQHGMACERDPSIIGQVAWTGDASVCSLAEYHHPNWLTLLTDSDVRLFE